MARCAARSPSRRFSPPMSGRSTNSLLGPSAPGSAVRPGSSPGHPLTSSRPARSMSPLSAVLPTCDWRLRDWSRPSPRQSCEARATAGSRFTFRTSSCALTALLASSRTYGVAAGRTTMSTPTRDTSHRSTTWPSSAKSPASSANGSMPAHTRPRSGGSWPARPTPPPSIPRSSPSRRESLRSQPPSGPSRSSVPRQSSPSSSPPGSPAL